MPTVSIITPCYNQGAFIQETIDSVLSQEFKDFEYIIVNDGSTDDYTNEKLKSVSHPKIRVIHTKNQGLASARNTAIENAAGEIILPLDSDDTIGKHYTQEAIKVLEKDSDVGIVYCIAELFGEQKGVWELPDYTLEKMLMNNQIFHCAFFRKKDWQTAGGYNPNMVFGWEDWDFWLSIIELGRKVHRLPGVHHQYRIRENSMVRQMQLEHRIAMRAQVMKNHSKLYIDNSDILAKIVEDYQKPFKDVLWTKVKNRLSLSKT
ncbi:glycosyl transferase [Chitinispirillum alkaliphilum]|nr:glycosyl transferase [Chitinispirillum alkaliphilum]